jgi:hypothetical protein
MARSDDSAARKDGPRPVSRLDPSEVPPELRDNPIVRHLVEASDEELRQLEELAELDDEGPPPGIDDDDTP